jgi:DNA replication protein DnaC
VTAAPPVLAADLNASLKRLKMAAMRRLGPELLVTARTQRWNPEEFLRNLVEAEIAARDASNARSRRRQAGFPVTKTLAEYDLTVSSVPTATFDYLGSLEWIQAAENVCLIGPAGTQ